MRPVLLALPLSALVAACTPYIAPAPEPAEAVVAQYMCGDLAVEVTFADENSLMRAGGAEYALAPVVTGSGAKYAAAGDGPETSFWSKGENGLLVIDGEEYPECGPVGAAPASAPAEGRWSAVGQEPGWMLTIEAGEAIFGYDYNQAQHTAAVTGPTPIEGGVEYIEGPGGLAVTRLYKVCQDVMSGIPYPDTVTVTLGDNVYRGCGGDAQAVLAGAEWGIEEINGQRVMDSARVTLTFEPADGRAGGTGGCNRWGASYTLNGEGISFGDAMSTQMACEEAVMQQEQAFHAALRAVTSYTVDETGALVLTGADNASIRARR
ncbi:META domain-containing protein [Hyphomonas sp.]|uniref:META domain-containing protein n=1 Tax=Hyphomonas sp. TaxID=87 RepID=UPI003919EF92